jgi:predicted membrane GTPase involved in stress response
MLKFTKVKVVKTRGDDMCVNVTKEKKQSNVRSSEMMKS